MTTSVQQKSRRLKTEFIRLQSDFRCMVDEMWLDHADRTRKRPSVSVSEVRLENALFKMEELLAREERRQKAAAPQGPRNSFPWSENDA